MLELGKIIRCLVRRRDFRIIRYVFVDVLRYGNFEFVDGIKN